MTLRVAPVSPGTRPELAELEARIRSERGGEVPLLYEVLLNSAPVASGWERMLSAIRNQSLVPADLRELIILRIAVINRASFEFEAHLPHALKAGVSQVKIDALRQDPPPEAVYTELENLVLELTDQMTRNVDVAEETMSRVTAHFDNRGVVELVATVAAYNMVSRFLVALNIVH